MSEKGFIDGIAVSLKDGIKVRFGLQPDDINAIEEEINRVSEDGKYPGIVFTKAFWEIAGNRIGWDAFAAGMHYFHHLWAISPVESVMVERPRRKREPKTMHEVLDLHLTEGDKMFRVEMFANGYKYLKKIQGGNLVVGWSIDGEYREEVDDERFLQNHLK